jgi:signal transduction histidine kinase
MIVRRAGEKMTRSRALVLLRYTFIIAVSYLLLVEHDFSSPPAGLILLILAALASNLVMSQLPARITDSTAFYAGIIIGDTVWITATLLYSGHFSAEFFYLYFFVLLLAAIGESLGLIAVGTLVVSTAYVLVLYVAGGSASLWSPRLLIRIPFLFTAAAFYGYLVDQVRRERQRARQEAEAVARLEEVRGKLAEHAVQLERTNAELEREISERKRAEQMREALYRASLAIQEPLGLTERLERFLHVTRTVLELDRVNILLPDRDGQWLHAAASIGTEEPLEAIRVPIGPEGGAVAQAYLTKQAIFWDGRGPVPEEFRLAPPYDQIAALRSRIFANVPLIVHGRAIGVLGADRKHSRRPLDSATLELLQLFAVQAALAIDNARLFQDTKEKSERLQILNGLSRTVSATLDPQQVLDFVVEATAGLLGVNLARVWLWDKPAQELRLAASSGDPDLLVHPRQVIRSGEGMAGLAFQRRKTLATDSPATDPHFAQKAWAHEKGIRAHAGVPLLVGERAVGTLSAARRDPRPFDQEDLALLASFAAQAAIAIENARLYQEGREHSATLEAQVRERRRAEEELKATQLQLIQSEKFESVGRLAAGVAHEVKNPLAIILQGLAYLSQAFLTTEDDNVALVLEKMDKAVRRADRVTRGLLDFSAQSAVEVTPTELNAVVEQSLLLVEHESVRAHVAVVKELGEDLPPLKLDRQKIEQVFVNLFMNAIQAMPEGGTLTVRTHAKQRTEPGPNVGRRETDPFRAGKFRVVAEVEDSGTGIPDEKLHRVFDPFFTTKPTGQGTGLGLTVTRKIIELHQGIIDIRNRQEGGVRVTLTFKAEGGHDDAEETRSQNQRVQTT